MSVAIIKPEELQAIYSRILGLPFKTFVDEQKIREALASVFIANKAAIAMTYNEDVTITMELLEIEDSAVFHREFLKLYEDIGLLLYNCITNGGRDFLPSRDRNVLRNIQEAIARNVLEESATGNQAAVNCQADEHFHFLFKWIEQRALELPDEEDAKHVLFSLKPKEVKV